MDGRRARLICSAAAWLALTIPLIASPVAAASCTISAPASVKVGTPVTIGGSGFPELTSVDISIGRERSTPAQFTVQSDSAGAFTLSLTPEQSEIGQTTVVATSGASCSAQALFTVGTATPVASAKPAVSGAANASSPGAPTSPPKTDSLSQSIGGNTRVPVLAWALALTMVLVGVSGLIATRRAAGH
jgi:hypothetical protein